MSLAQDGPGFHCLNKQLFAMMTGREGETTAPDEITDPDIKECLEMLEKITDVQKRDQFLAKFGDWLADRGINPYRMAVADKESMKEMVIKYHVFYRTSSEIAQFKNGMDDVCSMWGMVTKHVSVFQPLFCNLPKPLMKQEMDRIIRYDFSELGSNARTSEDETVYAWELFLQDIEDGIVPTTMAELLSFISGAASIPPCGFQKPIEIHFYMQEDGVTRLPYASTCSLDLWLPRGQTPENLSTLLLKSVNESMGFFFNMKIAIKKG
ncbi:hypothetical protein DPMN_155048 [Dreissena polymorpha]|uniref:HECT domain-containing protein n=2 Tax=Dreissena polymorpha TaxID=45954 RepID=A0A9D4FM73_DREPO|nr:hypothetical protein DPMN_155048 [Dreissena polymorpha]